MAEDKSTRLNKFLALELGISRRAADELITGGKVTIDDTVADLGARVYPDSVVKVNGTSVKKDATLIYLAFNKPVGHVCSRRAQGDNPTIYVLLPSKYHALKPVGRLDKDSSGLILLTNDGDFAHRMTHPSFHKVKIYEVQLDKPLEPLHQQMISDYGITLEDGKSQFIVERVEEPLATSSGETSATPTNPVAYTRNVGREAVSPDDGGEKANTVYRITMNEGRNRQIRRTFAALGYTVTYLHRTQFGNYRIDGLKPGNFRITTPQ